MPKAHHVYGVVGILLVLTVVSIIFVHGMSKDSPSRPKEEQEGAPPHNTLNGRDAETSRNTHSLQQAAGTTKSHDGSGSNGNGTNHMPHQSGSTPHPSTHTEKGAASACLAPIDRLFNDASVGECGAPSNQCCFVFPHERKCPESMVSTGARDASANKLYCSPDAAQACAIGPYGCGLERAENLCSSLKKSGDRLTVSWDDKITISESDCKNHLGNGDSVPVKLKGMKFFESWNKQCKDVANYLSPRGFTNLRCKDSGWKISSMR